MAMPTIDTTIIIRPGDNVDSERLFNQVCREYSAGKIEQDANGDILIVAPTGGESSYRNSEINLQLGLWTKRDGRGKAFDSQVLFILPDGSKKSPDASWVRNEKLLKLPGSERREFLRLVPDFVIELMSPSDQFLETKRKMEQYRDNGVELGWLIHPDRREVLIYRSGRDDSPEVLKNPEQVIGDGLVAGFALELVEIWKGLEM